MLPDPLELPGQLESGPANQAPNQFSVVISRWLARTAFTSEMLSLGPSYALSANIGICRALMCTPQ